MRKYILSGVLGLSSIAAFAQLSVPAGGLTILSGASFVTDSLVFQPSANFTMASVTIQKSNTPVPNTSGPASITHKYTISAPLTFTGTMGMYYNTAELNGNTESLLQMASLSGGTWATSSGGTVNTTSHLIQNSFTGLNFQDLTATQQGNVLPLRFLSFTASAAGGDIILHWQTAQEQNVKTFLIEQSPDARDFLQIGMVAAIGNSPTPTSYSFAHPGPPTGAHFYRLKELDVDGNYTYSRVIRYQWEGSPDLALYPNPASGKVTLQYASANDQEVWITDRTGRIIRKYQITAGAEATVLSLTGFAKGIYYIQLPGSNTTPKQLFIE